jgi:hypothetical protein
MEENNFKNNSDMLKDILTMNIGFEETKELMRKTIIEFERSETREKRKKTIKKTIKRT